jgi:hypothetical protein
MVTRGADESHRKSEKDILLSCQDEVYYFDTIKDILASQVANKLLFAGDYTLEGKIVEATYKSQIKKYIQEDTARQGFKKIIDGFKKEGYKPSDSNTLTIQYTVIENDLSDPITRHGKVYKVVGYLDFKFLLDDKMVYEAKADYIGRMGEDIPRRARCILDSFGAI